MLSHDRTDQSYFIIRGLSQLYWPTLHDTLDVRISLMQ